MSGCDTSNKVFSACRPVIEVGLMKWDVSRGDDGAEGDVGNPGDDREFACDGGCGDIDFWIGVDSHNGELGIGS